MINAMAKTSLALPTDRLLVPGAAEGSHRDL